MPAGKLGLAWENGSPAILENGSVYNIDSPTWAYDGSVPATLPCIMHGSIKIVTVKQGFAGISFEDGHLNILSPGRHVLTKPTHAFGGFLSTGQQTLSIPAITSMSSDNVGLIFDASVTVQVSDAHKAVTTLANGNADVFDSKNMLQAVIEKAKLALSAIVGGNRLNNPKKTKVAIGGQHISADAREKMPSLPAHGLAMDHQDPEADHMDEGSFKQVLHDTFLATFAESMAKDCGIVVVDFSVEDVKFTDPELASALAKGAVARTDLIKAEIDMQVKRTQAAAEQQGEVMRAEGRARAIAIIADAEASRIQKLDAAMSTVSATTAQRELVLAAGEVLKSSTSSLVLAHSAADVANLLGASLMSKGANGLISNGGAR